ncbi:MAG: hypothetical protein IPG10_03800 [Flavobacteriales bacterium]|nr:hypothetical protein [Flavobacteriales bacterium]
MRTMIWAMLVIALLPGCGTNKQVVDAPLRSADPRWAGVDSLMSIGQYATALEGTERILQEATTPEDWRARFKAYLLRGQLKQMTGTDAYAVLAELERTTDSLQAAGNEVPLVPLLHSVLAEGWWNTYQQDRWRILERTNLEDNAADPATWSQRAFMARVLLHAQASLQPRDSLLRIPTGDLGELLRFDPNLPSAQQRTGIALRPTVFDVVGHRAVALFANSETRLAEPAWRFRLDDPRHFALFEEFVYKPLRHRDSTAWEFQALRLQQQLELAHMSDDRPDALVDAILSRLAHVHAHSVLPEKDSLYLAALEKLRTRVPQDSCWSEVTTVIAQWHHEQSVKYDRLAGDAWKNEKRTARDLCNEAIATFPGSFGAQQAAALKFALEQPAVNVQCETATPPDQAFKVAVRYTNTSRVWLRIVKDPEELGRERRWDHDHGLWLTQQKPVREWSVDLPDDGDLNEHLAELPIDALPLGRYSILISNAAEFTAKRDVIAHAPVQVTRLSLVERRVRNELDLVVLDRWTGVPQPGVKVILFADNQRAQELARMGEAITDVEGRPSPKLLGANGRYSIRLEQGEDQWSTSYGYAWWGGEQGITDSLRTFLFTDRAIYRPGQEVFFKGIVSVKRGKTTEVKAGYATRVNFYDVNGELIDSAKVKTDAFGSFKGSFKAPVGALTGSMRIEEQHGSRTVQVEEYKRPTFEVVFNPIAGQPKLEQPVLVSGVAKSYAGVPLDGAQVQWTVKRGARMPWWCGFGWRGLPWGQETEIASGTSACDAQGKFSITFTALADVAFPRDADPTFYYTVEANATDITGETQRGTTSLNLAYRSIDIALNVGEAIDRERADSLDVRVRNLNGEEVDVPMDITIAQLQAPPLPLRDRLWDRPDRFVLTQEEHAQRFPQDVYANEDDPLSWPLANTVFQRAQYRANGKPLSLAGVDAWPVGSYAIEVTVKDADGREVKARKVISVYDTAIQNTGFVSAFHAEPVITTCEPGEKAVLLLSSALPDARVLMEVERDGMIAVSRRFILNKGQQRVELPVLESDRGGFAVHLLCVERGQVHRETIWIDVPWTNKQLQVEWMSFRDKLQPGDKEEWRLKLKGPKGEQVTAQLLAGMYDASLDHFVPHDWSMSLWGRNDARYGWSRAEPFGAAYGQMLYREVVGPPGASRSYPSLDTYGFAEPYGWMYRGGRAESMMLMEADGVGTRTREGNAAQSAPAMVPPTDGDKAGEEEPSKKGEAKPEDPAPPPATDNPQPTTIRSDFRETAFFFPDLLTERDGSFVLRFTTPDALTRWRVFGVGHTKDLMLAQFGKETITQKPLMVVPNLPRFLRAGDRIALTAKINLVEAGRAEGTATLELFDPFTNASLNKSFGVQVGDQVFIASQGESAVVQWSVTVPEDVDAVGVRITARSKAGPMSTIVAADGEERVLPILTDKLLVTESLPLWISKAGTKTFTLEKLKANTSTTLRSQSLKLEYTPNPAWYAVQALPYLMEFPHECAEQLFSRYYANRLATHIVEERPAIKKVFAKWKAAGPEAFASALEKNQDLKNILLAETPWVVNARNDRERKERIALLFDLKRMAAEEATALKKLRDMQSPSGAWPWWTGMQESRWITQHIVAGLGHLEQLKAADLREDGETQRMLRSAVQWLDADVDREYKRLQRDLKKDDLDKYMPGYGEIQYLYARTFFRRWPITGGTNTAVEFYKQRLAKEWLKYGLQEQAMIALTLHRMDDRTTATLILESVRQRAVQSEELGMYWKDFRGGMDWWSYPTETHALMIEAFHEVAKDEASVNALRTHLLKLKQTTDWRTTKATAEACYALLLTGSEWLTEDQAPVIKVGGTAIPAANAEAGTGVFEKSWTADEIKPALAEVTITSTANKPSWGALHWQYFERMDKITPHESPFSIKKQVMLTEQTDAGPQLVELGGTRKLKAGDKLTIRIELRTDRPVDYVHLKDLRAAGLEPTEALSGYQWKGGLGYYQSIRDASMNFFFDRIPAGTHVFEYTLRVTHAGDFSNGITTAMCMYAPEFSSHSEGVRIAVGE